MSLYVADWGLIYARPDRGAGNDLEGRLSISQFAMIDRQNAAPSSLHGWLRLQAKIVHCINVIGTIDPEKTLKLT